MPTLVFSKHQCELAIEAILCLRTGRLGRDSPNLLEAQDLQDMADYLAAMLVPESLPRPAPRLSDPEEGQWS